MANYNNKANYNIGDTFYNWKIIGHSDKRGHNNSTYVKCQCICGKIKDVDLHNLRRGQSKSCGCIKPIKPINVQQIKIGDVFGKLTVIEKTDGKNCWKCKCECGNITFASGNRLRSGMKRSCGCLRENTIKASKLRFTKSFADWCIENDLEYILDLWDYELNGCDPNNVGFKSRKECYFRCPNNLHESESFKLANAVNNYLHSGYFFVCRKCMLQSSQSEEHINHFLYKYRYHYIRQYKFDDCRDIHPLPFDFYLPDFNIVIEYDGEHHFYPVNHGENDKEKTISKFEATKRHDKIKTDYCKRNHIKLIRIPYYRIDDYDDIQYFLWDKLYKYRAIVA